MNLIFKNSKSEDEIIIDCRNSISFDHFDCSVELSHRPFYATLEVVFTHNEFTLLSDHLSKMYKFETNKYYSFTSLNREFIMVFNMSITGHITANVQVYAGSRGSLRFDFDFDQSFIPEIIEQIKQLSE